MIKLKVYSQNGEIVGEKELPNKIFEVEPNDIAIYEAIKMYQANKRQGTASTKTRIEVRGGGRKPWPQKHIGRARAGSIRSPLWRGGGVTFGPKPRNYHYRIPKKILKLALFSVLSYKARDGEIMLLDKINFEYAKTKLFIQMMKDLGLDFNKKVLFVPDKVDEKVYKSGRNIKNVYFKNAMELNALDSANAHLIIFTLDGLTTLEKRAK